MKQAGEAARAQEERLAQLPAGVDSLRISRELRRLYPELPILAPGKALPRERGELFWCVNPLDGRTEFLERSGQFTVNVGLCERDEPIRR